MSSGDTKLRNTSRRTFVRAVGGTVGASGLAGTGSAFGPTAMTTGTQSAVTIGVLGPRTGPLSRLWSFYIENIKLAVNQINGDGNFVHDGGGLDVGGETMTLDFKALDTEAKPNVGVSAAERLIDQDGVPMLLGAMSSTVTLAIMEVTGESKVPQITSVSTNPKITTPPTWHKWMFRNKDTDQIRARWITEAMAEELGFESVGMIGPNNDFGVGRMDVFEKRLGELGTETVSRQAFNPDQQSFLTELQQIKSQNPDVLYLAINDPAHCELIIPQGRQVGFKNIMTTAPCSSPDTPEAVGDALDGVYVELVLPSDPTGVAEHVTSWTNALNEFTNGEVQPNFIGAPTYDAVNAIAAAIERAGSTDRAAIRDAMTKTEMTGVYPYPDFTLTFNENNQAQVVSGVAQWQPDDTLQVLTGPFADS